MTANDCTIERNNTNNILAHYNCNNNGRYNNWSVQVDDVRVKANKYKNVILRKLKITVYIVQHSKVKIIYQYVFSIFVLQTWVFFVTWSTWSTSIL